MTVPNKPLAIMLQEVNALRAEMDLPPIKVGARDAAALAVPSAPADLDMALALAAGSSELDASTMCNACDKYVDMGTLRCGCEGRIWCRRCGKPNAESIPSTRPASWGCACRASAKPQPAPGQVWRTPPGMGGIHVVGDVQCGMLVSWKDWPNWGMTVSRLLESGSSSPLR